MERPARRSPEEFRALILDAAADCLVEGGFASGRLLSAIARKAGVSRPTLYKYGGTVDDIKEALVERELASFIGGLAPFLDDLEWSVDYLVDLLVFVVGYARGHPLLKAALRDVPELVLPVFTLHADTQLRRIEEFLGPVLQAHIDSGRMPELNVTILIDALYRITLSAVLINGLHDFDDPDALRSYLHTAVRLLADAPLSH